MTFSRDTLLPGERLPQKTIMLEFGMSTGAQIRGRLGMPEGHRVIDALNNWKEASIPLSDVELGNGAMAELAVVARSEILWGRPVTEVGRHASSEFLVEKVPRSVVADVGPFRLRGTAFTFSTVRWIDFMIALAGQFFPLTDVEIERIATTGEVLRAPFLAVNAARIATLFVLRGEEAP